MAPPDGTDLTTVRVSTLEQLVRAPPVSVSISMVSAHILKRSREPSLDTTQEPERKRQRVDVVQRPNPPVKGHRPLFPVVIRLANKKRIKITALYDTGAESFCLSSHFCSKYMVPQVQRDRPQRIMTYSGHTGPGGEAYSEPIRFELFGGLFEQPCEVLPLEIGYDMIIPYWWTEQVGLKFNALPDGLG